MKNKILIEVERLKHPHSGIAKVCSMLIEGIACFAPSINITYFTQKKLLNKSKYPVLPLLFWHKIFPPSVKDFSLLHITHQLSRYFHADYKNTIKILTVHDLNFLHEDLSLKKRRKMLRRVNKNLKHTDYVVCISHFVKNDFLKNKHLLDVNRLKSIRVIYNGLKFPERKNYDLGRFSFLKEKEFILNIGVLFPKKNQKAIIEMLPSLSEDLVLIASDKKQSYATELQQRAEQLNLQKRIHIFQNVTEQEKYALLQHCKSYFHPSVAEGFGIPPIEAMAFGKPVFLSKFTSLPEVGGSLAYYFDDFTPKHMVEVYKNGMNHYFSNLQEYQLKAQQWVSQFDYKTMAKQYLELYTEVTANRK